VTLPPTNPPAHPPAPLPEPAAPDIPEGFERRPHGGPYFQALGPVYLKPAADGGVVVALRVDHRHTNLAGITHGGMLSTLIDGAFGINIALRRGRHTGQVTVSLNSDFLSPARPGDWLEAHITVRRLGRQLAFADGVLQVGTRTVLRSTAVFAFTAAGGAAQPDARDG
jgi:uncharacterized protein (TIGR00369 family)